MTLHLLSFKSPETQYFEKQMDANEKLNTIKHNQIEQKINELKNEQNLVTIQLYSMIKKFMTI